MTTLAHPIDPNAEQRTEEDGKETDDERQQQTVRDETPAVLRQQVLMYGMLTARNETALVVLGVSVQRKIGAVEIVVRVTKRELQLPFGCDEHAA